MFLNYLMNKTKRKCGTWDERGLLNSFRKKGINNFSAISEYFGNSIDAGAKQIGLLFEKDRFIVIDNGSGLTQENIPNMFSNYRSNHSGDQSIGSVGIGGKLANAFLSQYAHDSFILTKSKDGLLKINIPWKNIYEDGKYEGRITFEEISELTYIDKFLKYIDSVGSNGCVIIHNISNLKESQLYIDVIDQFTRIPEKVIICEKGKRWDCMFTHPSLEIKLIDNTTIPEWNQKLNRYKHLDKTLEYYENGIQEYEIRIFSNDKGDSKLVVKINGIPCYINSHGSNKYKSKPDTYHSLEYPDYRDIGERFKYSVGSEINTDYFDPRNPSDKNLGKSLLGPTDAKFFNDSKDQRRDCCKTSIFRNGQQIGSCNLPNYKYSQQDGGKGTEKKTFSITSTKDKLEYFTDSEQNNNLDNIIGVQEIKNHINESAIRKDLLRLIDSCRTDYVNRVYAWFQTLIFNKKRLSAIKIQSLFRGLLVRNQHPQINKRNNIILENHLNSNLPTPPNSPKAIINKIENEPELKEPKINLENEIIEDNNEINEKETSDLLEIKANNQKRLLEELQTHDISKLSLKDLDYYYYKLFQDKSNNPELEKIYEEISGLRIKMNQSMVEEEVKYIYLLLEENKYNICQSIPDENQHILKLPFDKDTVDTFESNIKRKLVNLVDISQLTVVRLIITEYNNYLNS